MTNCLSKGYQEELTGQKWKETQRTGPWDKKWHWKEAISSKQLPRVAIKTSLPWKSFPGKTSSATSCSSVSAALSRIFSWDPQADTAPNTSIAIWTLIFPTEMTVPMRRWSFRGDEVWQLPVGELRPENDKFPHNEKNPIHTLTEHDGLSPWKQQQGQLSPPAQRLDFNLPAFHFDWSLQIIQILTYAEPHIWTRKFLGYSLLIFSSEYWRDCSKSQRKELSLLLARHLLCSSLGGSQEIRQPLSPRNQFWCPL